MKINNTVLISGCPRGGMVDTRDLKSLGLIGRASSSLAVGTRYVKINIEEKVMFMKDNLTLSYEAF